MRLTLFISALALVLGFTMPGAKEAEAASAISSPARALGQQIAGLNGANFAEAGVSFHLHVGPRRRYYRRWRKRRRPRIHLYIGPRPRYRYYKKRRRYGRCGYWRRKCGRNWGYGNSSYYGCLRYHGCR